MTIVEFIAHCLHACARRVQEQDGADCGLEPGRAAETCAPRSRSRIELCARCPRAGARVGPQRTAMLRISWLRASRGRERNSPHRHRPGNGARGCGHAVRAIHRQRACTFVMRVRDFEFCRDGHVKGAARFQSRGRRGHDALDRSTCLRRVLRPAVCVAGDNARHHRSAAGMVRQNSNVGQDPCRPFGLGCMGMDRLAEPPHAPQASRSDTGDDGRGDHGFDGRHAMAAAREADHSPAARLTPRRPNPLP